MNGLNQARRSANTRRNSGVSLTGRVSTATSSSSDAATSDDSHVKVAVRCRPMSEKEISDGHESIVEFESDKRIVVHDTSESPSDLLGTQSGERRNYSHVYDFDHVFDCNSTQKQVYDQVCRPIVQSVLEGYNGTIFAYGQTGTGKTYTMEGLGRRKLSTSDANTKRKRSVSSERQTSSAKSSEQMQYKQFPSTIEPSTDRQQSTEETAGIIPRTFQQIFDHIARNTKTQFLIRASYLEIYQEEIRDLLRKDKNTKLELHERTDIGVYVKDLTSFVCKSITEIERVMRVGNQNRIVGATDMNEHSSRSHAIFMITVEQQSTVNDAHQAVNGSNQTQAVANKVNKDRVIRVGKLNLVDLAGSERQRKTNSFGQRQRESIKINLSLSALGNVINSLMKIHSDKQQSCKSAGGTTKSITQQHTPYRDSKLTRLLQDSLGGNAKTLMIASIGPASYNYDETINTLNYASLARCIRNRPRLNEDPKDALLRELQREIDSLRSKLSRKDGTTNNHSAINDRQVLPSSGLPASVVKSKEENQLIERELLELKQKLASLEGKLLNGDKIGIGATNLDPNVLKGLTHVQELELERRRKELASQAGRERAIRDELERREEAELLAKKSFNSIQQEVDAKRRLIRQILLKVRTLRDEIDETQRAYRLELDDLDQLQYVLQKELKLKCLIMDNFIPNSHVDQLLPRVMYDEHRNICSIEPIELPIGCCLLGDIGESYSDYWHPTYDSIRPRSEFERIGEAVDPSNIRHKYEELIEPSLELPKQKLCRRLRQTDEPSSAQDLETTRLQAMIDSALNQREPDIVI